MLTRSGLCMSNLCPLHQLAGQHFDERYKRKQSEPFLSWPFLNTPFGSLGTEL